MMQGALRAGAVLRTFTLLAILPALASQAQNQRSVAVGMRARIDELPLPGSELVAAPADRQAPLVLRILATRRHGDHFRYDLEWCGLEAGSHDLVRYLARKDGSSTADLAPLQVSVTASLGAGVFEPGELVPKPAERIGGYRNWLIVAAVVWTAGLLAILLVGRRRRAAVTASARIPTLADRLRPLVEAVAAGRANDASKAELERLLVAYWRSRLGLLNAKAPEALSQIRHHTQAGELLRQVEAWLHRPDPPAALDLSVLLAPYRHVRAADLEPEPAMEQR